MILPSTPPPDFADESMDAYRGPRPMRPADPAAHVIAYLGVAIALPVIALALWLWNPVLGIIGGYAAGWFCAVVARRGW